MDEIANGGNRFTFCQPLNLTQPVGKTGERVIAAPGERLAQPQIKTGGKQAFVPRHRPLAQFLQRGGADFTFWRIHDTQERTVIIRIGQHPQIGQQIFNFRTRKERGAAGNFVGNTVLHEEFFEHPRLVVAAIQNGVIFIFRFIHKVMGDEFPGHPLGFVLFVVGAQYFELLAVA